MSITSRKWYPSFCFIEEITNSVFPPEPVKGNVIVSSSVKDIAILSPLISISDTVIAFTTSLLFIV